MAEYVRFTTYVRFITAFDVLLTTYYLLCTTHVRFTTACLLGNTDGVRALLTIYYLLPPVQSLKADFDQARRLGPTRAQLNMQNGFGSFGFF